MVETYFVCHKRKTIFARIPKAGVESIRHLILMELGLYTNPSSLWSNVPVINKQQKNILTKRGYKYIVIMRNPFERLVSGFTDKILRASPTYKLKEVKKMIEHFGYKITDKDKINFEEFVDYITSKRERDLDFHFKPATLMFEKNHDYIFDLKDGDLINIYLKKLGFKNKLLNYNTQVWQRGCSNKIESDICVSDKRFSFFEPYILNHQTFSYKHFYTKDIISKVSYYFTEDIRYFKFRVKNKKLI